MFRYRVPLFSVLLITTIGRSQSRQFTEVETNIVSTLQSDSAFISTINLPLWLNFGIGAEKSQNGVILKCRKTIYLLFQGTNWVYRLNDSANRFERIDTTFFRGSNFNAYFFSYNDNLYQYGGYGFWTYRDFISYYIPKTRDWEFIVSPRYIENNYTPFRLFWVDQQSGKLYIDGFLKYNRGRNNTAIYTDSVFEYDITSNRWSALGKLRGDFRDQALVNICETPDGILCRLYAKFYLASFRKNQLIPLSDSLSNLLYLFYDHTISGQGMKLENLLPFYLRDTLYLILGNSERYVSTKFPFSHNELNYEKAEKLLFSI